MRMRGLVGLVILLAPAWGLAQASSPGPLSPAFSAGALRDLRLVVVQHGGRAKPLDSLARENVEFITGRNRYQHQDPLVTYMAWVVQGDSWYDVPLLRIDYLPLRKAVGLDAARNTYSVRELRSNDALMQLFRTVDQKTRTEQKLDKIEDAAQTVGTRLLIFDEAMRGDALQIVPNPMDKTGAWFTLSQAAQAPFFDVSALRDAMSQVADAFRTANSASLASAAAALRTAQARLAPDSMPPASKISREVRFFALNPYHRAWILYFAAFVLLLFALALHGRLWYLGGMALLVAGFAIHVYGMALRVLVAGRPPVSNIYESMIFMAAAIVLFSLVFEAIYRSRVFALTAAALGVIALVLAEHLPLGTEIALLQPVLRSTTWLTFHVLTIMLGYASAFFAGGLAFVGLGCHAVGRGDGPLAVALDQFHYRVVQLAVLFLGAGIILGGVWANQSWGRYWGWDPKETWALISLIVYLVIAHGRYAGWLRRFGTNVVSVVGLNMVIMTYYGVNYFLVGLHSYAGVGKAPNVPPWVYIFLGAETIFVLLAYFGGASRRRQPVRPSVLAPPPPPATQA
jgi:ABC-type transport system involved in cytochrome c biogenesis permease subunit